MGKEGMVKGKEERETEEKRKGSLRYAFRGLKGTIS